MSGSTGTKRTWDDFAIQFLQQVQQLQHLERINSWMDKRSTAVPLFSGFELYTYGRMIAFKKICRANKLSYSSDMTRRYMHHLHLEWHSLGEADRHNFDLCAVRMDLQLLSGFTKDLECMQHPPK